MITSRMLTVAFLLVPAFVLPANAQRGGFIKQRAKERVERKIAECIATDLACLEKAKAEGKEVTIKEAQHRLRLPPSLRLRAPKRRRALRSNRAKAPG